MRKLNLLTQKTTFVQLNKEQQSLIKGGGDIKATADEIKAAKDIKNAAQSIQP